MNQQQSVLYDAPGPRARRVTLIGSVIAVVGIAACRLYFLVYRPLGRTRASSRWRSGAR